MNQSESGKAFEYALAIALAETTNSKCRRDSPLLTARDCYEKSREKDGLKQAADEAAIFITAFDKKLTNGQVKEIFIQSDFVGRGGDVRDIVIVMKSTGYTAGFSAKNRHYAIKHQRLSDTIDFGRVWAGYSVSSRYWQSVKPTFQMMRKLELKGVMFRNVQNKEAMIYLPILTAFEDELKRLCETYSKRFISSFSLPYRQA